MVVNDNALRRPDVFRLQAGFHRFCVDQMLCDRRKSVGAGLLAMRSAHSTPPDRTPIASKPAPTIIPFPSNQRRTTMVHDYCSLPHTDVTVLLHFPPKLQKNMPFVGA
jgi:hypothetical protein